MKTEAEETQEDKIGYIGQEIVDSVPLGGTATTALTALSPAEERPTKNRPVQHIRYGTKTTETASQLDYQARDCSGRSQQ